MMKRLLAVWHARNLEFVRDRGTLIFSLLLPIALVVGMSFVFGGKRAAAVQGGRARGRRRHGGPSVPERAVRRLRARSPTEADAIRKVSRHSLDLLVDVHDPGALLGEPSSPKGYIVEKLLLQADRTRAAAACDGRRRSATSTGCSPAFSA